MIGRTQAGKGRSDPSSGGWRQRREAVMAALTRFFALALFLGACMSDATNPSPSPQQILGVVKALNQGS